MNATTATQPTVSARGLPRHVGIVMDGNGRWAEQRGLSRSHGHEHGARAVRRVVRDARRLGIEALTLFAFSTQNWARPDDEVQALMALLGRYLRDEKPALARDGVALRAVGDLSRLPDDVRRELTHVDAAPASPMLLTLALSYGGQEEITEAARALACAVARGELDPSRITKAHLDAQIPSVLPGEPDLLVRTGGEHRLSNFLVWGAAYAELHFSPVLWPDFDTHDLYEAIESYQRRERRFGLTTAQTQRASAHTHAPVVPPRPVA